MEKVVLLFLGDSRHRTWLHNKYPDIKLVPMLTWP